MGPCRHPFPLALALLGAMVGTGCRVGDDSVGVGDGAITGSSCSIFNNQTGKPLTGEELAKLDDPIAKKLLEGACPKSYSEALAKLGENDANGCADAQGGPQAAGLGSFLVSESAAFAKSPEEAAARGYRTVITKTCEGRKNDEMLFSGFASPRGASETNLEMIGKDATTGVFNYYELLDGGAWVFYGDSFDFVGNGYTCKESGYCVSNNSKLSPETAARSPSKKACASCHGSGGLLMKELDSPWVHWTTRSPRGADLVVRAHPDRLGNPMAGASLDSQVVKPSFGPYNQKRLAFLASKGLEELLRPLFCTLDINLDSRFLGSTLVVDKELAFNPLGTAADAADGAYARLKKQANQRVELDSSLGIHPDDTASPFTYPTRGQIDRAYADALKAANLIDEELEHDVLDVDFTRPTFSGLRCQLLGVIEGKTASIDAKLARFAKAAPGGTRDTLAAEIAKDIPTVFTRALSEKPTRASADDKFLANLTDPSLNQEAHERSVSNFLQQCKRRLAGPTPAERDRALLDFMTFASHVRRTMRRDVVGMNGQALLEPHGAVDDKMVTDDLPDNPNAFDPETCELTLGPNAVRGPPRN